jgi:hypothetical protein
MEVAVDADLTVYEFRGCTHFQGFDLAEFTRMEIESARGVAFPDAELSDCQFIHIQKHMISPRFARIKAIICLP